MDQSGEIVEKMIMKKLFLFLLLLMTTGCNPLTKGITLIPISPSPVVQEFGVRPFTSLNMPFKWDCSIIPSGSVGFEWRGLQVGVTTYDEMVELLEPELVFRDVILDRIVFQQKFQYPGWDHPLNLLSACFWGDILSGLEIYRRNAEFPYWIEELVELYGEPDRVTWGYDAKTRAMVWAEKGFMAIIENVLGGDVAGLYAGPYFLFSPINAEELEGSWIMQVIPAPPPPSELAKMPPAWQVEDPWGYNDE